MTRSQRHCAGFASTVGTCRPMAPATRLPRPRYLRNRCAIHVVLATLVLAVLAGATLLRVWAASRGPDWLAHLVEGWLRWSPYTLLPLGLLGVVSFPLGWAYWFIQRDKNRQLSDWVAAPTAALIAVVALFALRATDSPAERALWLLRFFAVTPLLALLAWVIAWIRAKQQVGVDVEVFARSKLSQWLAASLMTAAGLMALAIVDSMGQALYRWLQSSGTQWSLKGGGLMGIVAALLAAIGRLAPLRQTTNEERHLSLPKNLLAGVAAVIVIGWILASLSAITYMLAARPKSGTGVGLTMDARALAWLTAGACIPSVLAQPDDPLHQQLFSSGALWESAYASLPGRVQSESIHTAAAASAFPIRSGATTSAGAYAPFESGGPLHIVNVTLNETVPVRPRSNSGIEKAFLWPLDRAV